MRKNAVARDWRQKGLNGKKIILSWKTAWLRLNLLVFALLVLLNRATP